MKVWPELVREQLGRAPRVGDWYYFHGGAPEKVETQDRLDQLYDEVEELVDVGTHPGFFFEIGRRVRAREDPGRGSEVAMSDEPKPGRLVRTLTPTTWNIEEEKWRVYVHEETEGKFCATLYHRINTRGYDSEREFTEGFGASKQEALDDLRKRAESQVAMIQSVLSFDWKADG